MTKESYTLTPDKMTLVVTRRAPGGVQTVTLRRRAPFTDTDVADALALIPGPGRQLPGQRSVTRRHETRFGVVWTHVMTGPPTWWFPRLLRENDGTLMTGWFRGAVAVKLERKGATL